MYRGNQIINISTFALITIIHYVFFLLGNEIYFWYKMHKHIYFFLIKRRKVCVKFDTALKDLLGKSKKANHENKV